MPNGADHSDGLALSFLDANAHFGVRDETVGFQHFGNLLLRLNFRQPRDMQAHGDQRNADGPCLTDPHLAAELFYVEDLDVEHIPVADDVVVRSYAHSSGEGLYAIVDLLRRFENGLLGAAGRQEQRNP